LVDPGCVQPRGRGILNNHHEVYNNNPFFSVPSYSYLLLRPFSNLGLHEIDIEKNPVREGEELSLRPEDLKSISQCPKMEEKCGVGTQPRTFLGSNQVTPRCPKEKKSLSEWNQDRDEGVKNPLTFKFSSWTHLMCSSKISI
jgi:hypothetical protein